MSRVCRQPFKLVKEGERAGKHGARAAAGCYLPVGNAIGT